MHDLCIVNGRIVTHKNISANTLCIKDGVIAAIVPPNENPPAVNTIDATGKLIFPGAIDCHCHFQVPGYTHRENFTTGSRAAAVGGVTTVIDMPLNNEPPVITSAAFQLKKRLVEGQSYVDYAFWGGIVDDNLDQIPALCRAGAVALKGFLSPVKEGDFVTLKLKQLDRAMSLTKSLGIPIGLHCEDYELLKEGKKRAIAENRQSIDDFLAVHTPYAECLAVKNAIEICRKTGARLHICHVSHPDAAELIQIAQQQGLPVTAETCPHYLGFTSKLLYEKGSVAKCTPPLRSQQAVDQLWKYLVNGCLSCVGSDHSPAMPEEKDDAHLTIWESWGGLNSIQFLMPHFYHLAVNQRGLSASIVAEKLAFQPAKLFGLSHKGQLAVGYDADIVIFDPETKWTATEDWLQTMHKVSVFMGVSGKGWPSYTFLRGQMTAKNRCYYEPAQGRGQLIINANSL